MEKENMFLSEGSTNRIPYGMGLQTNELNSGSDHLQNCFFNPNWESTMDQSDPFESALSSMVSSPVASNAAVSNGESIVLRELIGRLGNISSSGEISPPSYIGATNSTNTSCYSTPLNSPPKLNLSMMDHKIRGNLPFSGHHLPSHPSLPQFTADPGFAERAAKFSCFANRSLTGGLSGQVGLNEPEPTHRLVPKLTDCGNLSRVSSNQSIKISGFPNGSQEIRGGSLQNVIPPADKKFNRLSRCSSPENPEISDSRENSTVSEQITGKGNGLVNAQVDGSSKKRKSVPKGKGKEIPLSNSVKDVASENNESNPKRSKSNEDGATKKDTAKTKAEGNGTESENAADDGNQKQNKDNQKPSEPPKDYIHVRARRGQATDAHSLAERVRREKISERMKLLQDLVPGCNKVTGKAVMLDEIINYVQSLQRQVEFLSMKLATVNPRMDFNMESLLSMDIPQARGSLPQNVYQSNASTPALPYALQSQPGLNLQCALPKGTEVPFSMNQLNAALSRTPSMHLPPMEIFIEANPQVSAFWEDDLHSVVQMGFGQNQTPEFQG